jgi:hypothetical protein
MSLIDSILALCPEAQVSIIDDNINKIEWFFPDNTERPSKKEILEHYNNRKDTSYKFKRQLEYPSLGDQLDSLFHAGIFPKEMHEKIKIVKDKYSKPD